MAGIVAKQDFDSKWGLGEVSDPTQTFGNMFAVVFSTMNTNEAPPAKLILIADDSVENRNLYAHAMALAGYRCALAEDGDECLQRVRELGPDLVVMDLSLPTLDGLEATRRLKADKQTRHIPVIVLTAYGWQTVKEDAYRHGCQGFLVKPCPPDDLLREIGRLLSTAAQNS